LPAAAARRPAVASGGGANKMSVAAAIGGVAETINHYLVLMLRSIELVNS